MRAASAAVGLLLVLVAGCAEPTPPPFVPPSDLPDGQTPSNQQTSAGASPASGGDCGGEGPGRQVGDRWDYGQDYPVFTRFIVEAREERLGHDTLRINATMDEMFSDIAGYAEDPHYMLSWVCAGSGALVATRDVWNRTMGVEVEYDRPCLVVQYPLVVGAQWSTECSYRDRTHARGWIAFRERHEGTVVGNSSLELPSGTFDALEVRVNRTGWQGESSETHHLDPSLCAGPVVYRHEEPYYALGLDDWSCGGGPSSPP